jgi:uncharacterized protein (TIGR03083 family)
MPTTTQLSLTRTEIIEGMRAEYEAFATLVASLSDAEWARPTRCEGFDVRDVAGHVIGLAEDVVAGKPASRTAEQEAASVRDDPPARAAARLTAAVGALGGLAAAIDDDAVWAGPSGVDGLTMGEGVLSLWFDVYVHADDIRTAVGRARETGPGERASVAYLCHDLGKRGFGPARIELTGAGYPPIDIGAADASTATTRLGAHDFILAATGRLDPAPFGLGPDVNIFA